MANKLYGDFSIRPNTVTLYANKLVGRKKKKKETMIMTDAVLKGASICFLYEACV